MLGFALEEAYHALLMQGKHPIAVININIPPGQIDVNVHPAKTEIKFQDEKAVFSALQRAVRAVLVQASPVHEVADSRSHFQIPSVPFSLAQEPANFKTSPSTLPNRSTALPLPPTPLISLPLLRVLGQLACNYIVCEGPDGLYLIDQHAAHERIMLEKLQKQKLAGQVEKQGLLPAAAFEIEPRLAAVLNSHLNSVVEIGFEVEAFGPNAFMVRTIPAVLSGRDWPAALRESLETSTAEWSENLLNRLACHSAIRAGQVLSLDEMRELLRQLEKTDLPNSCPHGRPTMIRLTMPQIEKEFGRIQ
jgi:DNA mismatch repair protein MutL